MGDFFYIFPESKKTVSLPKKDPNVKKSEALFELGVQFAWVLVFSIMMCASDRWVFCLCSLRIEPQPSECVMYVYIKNVSRLLNARV